LNVNSINLPLENRFKLYNTPTGTFGIVGMGTMGSAIAGRIRQSGHHILGLSRHNATKQALLAMGARNCDNLDALFDGSVLVLLSVPDSDAVQEILHSQRHHIKNRIIVDLSTIGIADSIQHAEFVAQYGGAYLDAPMSGSIAAVEQGELGLLVGGETKILEYIKPLLQVFAKNIYHFGSNGCGIKVKLAQNLMLAAMAHAFAEATHFVRNEKIDMKLFVDALSTSGLKSPVFSRMGQRVINDDFSPRFSLELLKKDIQLFTAGTKHYRLASKLNDILQSYPSLNGIDYSYVVNLEQQYHE